MKKYLITDVIKQLDNLDDYDRTDTDSEQDAIKIAKYVLKELDCDTCFEVEFSKVKKTN